MDNSYKVVYKDTDVENVVKKLISMNLVSLSGLRQSANEYLWTQNKPVDKNELLVYFAMTGCPDCANADKIIEESSEIKNRFSITRIFRANDTDSSKIKDDYSIYKQIYEISWYPSFLVLDGSGSDRFIGEVPVDQIEPGILGDSR